MVPFAGYLLPIQYEEGIIKEHMAVRTKAGPGGYEAAIRLKS
jgi:aminomethyltransferase